MCMLQGGQGTLCPRRGRGKERPINIRGGLTDTEAHTYMVVTCDRVKALFVRRSVVRTDFITV